MKGIILAGGLGTRLYPITYNINKHLIPVYDKPMIYYPLSTLIYSNIKEIMIITSETQVILFQRLLGNGSHLGCSITYEIQSNPNGIAEAFLIAEKFIDKEPVTLILGDNIFHGKNFNNFIKKINFNEGALIFGYNVNNPKPYGVIVENKNNEIIDLVEKPTDVISNIAIPGFYIYDSTVVERTKKLVPSDRNELEITDLNKSYLNDNKLEYYKIDSKTKWLDTGTFDSLLEASNLVSSIQKETGELVGSPEQAAFINKFVTKEQLQYLANRSINSGYGEVLKNLVDDN